MKFMRVWTAAILVSLTALFGAGAQAETCALPSDPAVVLGIIFPLFDANGDGGLALAELNAIYPGIPAQYYNIVDSNHDGKVTVAEITPFLSLLGGVNPLALVDANGNGAIEYAEVGQYVTPAQFGLLDKDGNGVIDCADLNAVTPSEGEPVEGEPVEGEVTPPPPCPLPDDIVPILANLLMPLFDTDQSGGLSLAEIQALYPIPAQYVSFFTAIDQNRNGQVDPAELAAIASALGIDLLAQVDTSGDRIVQYAEVQQYVSSEQFSLIDRNGNGVFDCGDIATAEGEPVEGEPVEGEPVEGETPPAVCALPDDVISVLAGMLIPLFDADQSGGLSLAEIQALYAIPAEYTAYFSVVDFNHNGQIDADELVTIVNMLVADPLGEVDSNGDRAIQYDEVSEYLTPAQFALFDRNGNGAFDCGDLTVVSPEGEGEGTLPCAIPNVNSLVFDALFALLDANRDGGIAIDEITRYVPGVDTSQLQMAFSVLGAGNGGKISRAMLDLIPSLLPAFGVNLPNTNLLSLIDTNGDGLIQLAEVSPYISASIFALLDRNGNGVIDCEDVQALLQGFSFEGEPAEGEPVEGEPAEGEPVVACPLPDIRPMLPTVALLLDRNHDGKVCLDEVTGLLSPVLDLGTNALPVEYLSIIDGNGDGCIDQAELAALVNMIPVNPVSYIDANGNGVLEPGEVSMLISPSIFARADLNHNGVLDCEDLNAAVALLGGVEGEPAEGEPAEGEPAEGEPVEYCPVPADAVFGLVIRLVDVNGDGGISLEELQTVVPQVPSQLFPLGDTNGDGRIGEAELRALLAIPVIQTLLPMPNPVDILAMLDSNGNGALEYAELAAYFPKDRFDAVDTNQNGVIDCADVGTSPVEGEPVEGEGEPAEGETPPGLDGLLQGLHGGSENIARWLEDAFGMLDANGDDAVSYEEISGRIQFPKPLFDVLDTDGDGLLTWDDVAALVDHDGTDHEAVVEMIREVAGRFGNQFFAPGSTIRVTLRLVKHGDGVLSQLRLLEALPDGWTATLVSGAPGVTAKSTAANALVLEWSQATAFPLEVVYEATAPANASGLVTVTGQADYQTSDGVMQSTGAVASVLAEALPEDQTHTGDTDHDWHLSLSEVLRVVQFYNAGAYAASDGTEDGYEPGAGKQAGLPHDADYTGDWKIDISELLRVVQLFNAPGGAYYRAPGTEDGFVPGLF